MKEPLYREELLDHYRHPRNYGELAHAHAVAEVHNPSCGDSIMIQLYVQDGRVEAIAFQGKGCVISQAAASMLTLEVVGKSLAELKNYSAQQHMELLGITLGPTRMRCALLSLETVHKAIAQYTQGEHHA
jgi:nitrogen fixation NifU-like protein